MTWLEVVAVVGGGAGAGGAILGGIAEWRTRKVAAQGNNIAEQANRIAEGQQKTAAEQQQVAKRQLEIAEEQHRLEREREHDRLAPPQPAAIEAEVRGSSVGGRFLAGTITVPRDYRVRGEALVPASDSRRTLALDLVLRANQPVTFEIENWPEGREVPQTKALYLRFWPPNEELDKVPGRPCPCDRPDSDGDGKERGHWEWTVPVSYYDVLSSIY